MNTAQELWDKHFNGLHYDDITPEKMERYAIEFAKLHVQAALKSASEKAELKTVEKYHREIDLSVYEPYIDKESILNGYDIDNIK